MTRIVTKFTTADASTLADKRQVLTNVSAESADRSGDVVIQAGIQTANFMKTGGTILWQHIPDTPIAKAISIGVEGGKLRSLVQFPPAGVSAKSDEIFGLIGAGVVNSTSIGFRPIESEPIDPRDGWGGPRKYLSCELVEFSFVSTPAQPDATVVARDFKSRRRKSGADFEDPNLAEIAANLTAAARAQRRAAAAHEKARAAHAESEAHLSNLASVLKDCRDHLDALLGAGYRPPANPDGVDVDPGADVELHAPRPSNRRAALDKLDRANVGRADTAPSLRRLAATQGGGYVTMFARDEAARHAKAVGDALAANAVKKS